MASILRRVPARTTFWAVVSLFFAVPAMCLALLGRNAVGGALLPSLQSAFYSLLLAAVATAPLLPLSVGYAIQRYQMPPSHGRRFFDRFFHVLGAIPPVVCAAAVIVPVVWIGGNPSFLWAALAMTLGLLPRACTMSTDAVKAIPERYYLAGISLGAASGDAIWDIVLRMAGGRIRGNVLVLLSMALDQMALMHLALGFAPGFPPSDVSTLPMLLLASKQAGDMATASLAAVLLLLLSVLLSVMARRTVKEAL